MIDPTPIEINELMARVLSTLGNSEQTEVTLDLDSRIDLYDFIELIIDGRIDKRQASDILETLKGQVENTTFTDHQTSSQAESSSSAGSDRRFDEDKHIVARAIISDWREHQQRRALQTAYPQNIQAILSNLLKYISKYDEQAEQKRQNRCETLAQILSLRKDFQYQLEHLRHKWGITAFYPDEIDEYPSPDSILLNRIVHNDAENLLTIIRVEMRAKLCDKFEFLDWQMDYGLLVGALCYGLQPENVWDETQLQHLISLGMTRRIGETIRIHTDDSEKYMGAMLTIAYLSHVLRKYFAETTLVQEIMNSHKYSSLRAWMNTATGRSKYLGNFDEMPSLIDRINGAPSTPLKGEKSLLVEIGKSLKDYEYRSLWQLILARGYWLWDWKSTNYRPMENFQRDVLIRRRIASGMTVKEAIIDYQKDKPENATHAYGDPTNKLPTQNDIEAIERAMERIDAKIE